MKACFLFLLFSTSLLPAVMTADRGSGQRITGGRRRHRQYKKPSLESVVEKHRAAVVKEAGEVNAFEITVRNFKPSLLRTGQLAGGVEVESSFVSPRDDVWYYKVSEKVGAHTKDLQPPVPSKEGFIIKECTQGYVLPEMKCQQPTGEPEPKERHLPIRNWKVSLPRVGEVLSANKYSLSTFETLVVTTAGRVKNHPSDSDDAGGDALSRQLKGVPNDNAVISLAGRSEGGSGTISFVIIDAGSGNVLAKGSYELAPRSLPPP